MDQWAMMSKAGHMHQGQPIRCRIHRGASSPLPVVKRCAPWLSVTHDLLGSGFVPLPNPLAEPLTLNPRSTRVIVRCFKRTSTAQLSSAAFREIGLFGGGEGAHSTN